MNKKFAILFLTAIILLQLGATQIFAQENYEILENKKITLKMENVPVKVVFPYLMYEYDIPIGFEESTVDSSHNYYVFPTTLPKRRNELLPSDPVPVLSKNLIREKTHEHLLSLNLKDASLKVVLDSIVEQMKYYKWEIKDGVVNIFPIQGRDKRYEELLNLKVEAFYAGKSYSLGVTRALIFEIPEVEQFLAEKEISHSSIRIDPQYLSRPLGTDVDYSNLTVRDLLNKIAKIKKGGWSMRKNHYIDSTEKDYIDIDI